MIINAFAQSDVHNIQILRIRSGSRRAAVPRHDLTIDALSQALRDALQPEVATRAREIASRMELNGVRIAAERLMNEFGYRRWGGMVC